MAWCFLPYELYVMQRYLQYDALKEAGLMHFDSWASTFGETSSALEINPQGSGYRFKTRFAKFFNLPELMYMFKDVADIKTADQLDLPIPEITYETVVTKPSEIQKAIVQKLSDRADDVQNRLVEPFEDNMLAITNDGRKLGLDQRVFDPTLPDDPNSKVNKCIENVFKVWEDGKADKLTQLIFCDLSTPKAKKSITTQNEVNDNQDELCLDETKPTANFSVYHDIKTKLIAQGVPEKEIAFIHDAKTETAKKELFAKVRSGDVRVLIGSTAKCGAGTNIQDRLVAMHDLDAPWRPGDLIQRSGRIARQGNMNKHAKIFRYVTEGTFDSYIWQTLENKQKFISQIMTSKSPVRSCDDLDDFALTCAEVKALAAGDPKIKQRMDLDVEVSKLKLLRASHYNNKFSLEDRLLTYFPLAIKETQERIAGLEKDLSTLATNKAEKDKFAPMTIGNITYTDKKEAALAFKVCLKQIKGNKSVEIGSYRDMQMTINSNSFYGTHSITLKGEISYNLDLGEDIYGNFTRIENALENVENRLNSAKSKLDNLFMQQKNAEIEKDRPFPQEQELIEKTELFEKLNIELSDNLTKKNNGKNEIDSESKMMSEKPSVLAQLKNTEPKAKNEQKQQKPKQEVR